MSDFSNLSKKCSWEKRESNYPASQEEVEKACDYSIMTWYRNLPSPTTDREVCLMNLISTRFREMRTRLEKK